MVVSNMNKTYVAHHGIVGQKWGIRRYQNEDGTLTLAGRKKYDINEDGTTNIKDSYRKGKYVRGGIKSSVGSLLVTNGIRNIVDFKKMDKTFSSPDGKKTLNKAILSMTLGAIVITDGVRNFIEANKNRTFNSTGMGPTPETFTGKPKTAAQVIAKQNKEKNKK